MKQRFAIAALLAGTLATPALAVDYHVLEGAAVNHGDLGDDEVTGGVRGALGFDLLRSDWGATSLETGVFGGPIERNPAVKGTQLGLMLDLVQSFNLGLVNPYLMLGLGTSLEKDAGSHSEFQPAFEGGLGLMLGRAGGTQVRLGGQAMTVLNDNLSPQFDSFTDYRVVLGVSAPVGGAPVARTAAADRDGDGVPDARDRCPAQPARTADGCPAPLAPAMAEADADGDGIPDSKDECPGTLKGLSVAANGCAKGGAQKIVLQGVNFVTGQNALTAEAKGALDEAAAALAGQPSLKVEVGGHTDSMGNDANNQALSQRRAEAVRQYLIGKGISAGRLTAKGYGETQPIADNGTRQGRAENRRVELKILD